MNLYITTNVQGIENVLPLAIFFGCKSSNLLIVFSAAWADQGAMEELYMMCLLLRTVGAISAQAAEKKLK